MSISMGSYSSAAGPGRSATYPVDGDRGEWQGYREIFGICEGAKEDKAGWSAFLKHLKERGRVRLILSDACLGLAESAAEFFPDAVWQRWCIGTRHISRLGLTSQRVRGKIQHGILSMWINSRGATVGHVAPTQAAEECWTG
jgi:hypothetical protein